ncbi:MAG: hypothetical protein ACSW72_00270 [Bacteroidales bacterium]
MKILRLLILSSFLVLSPPIYAQLSLGANPQPATPQAAQMTKYGEHNANLYTGRVSVTIPVGEYRDKDFSVPVVLEYSYNGMRPNEQAAEPGLGWTLSCGGMITREVVGCADEEFGEFHLVLGTDPIETPVQPHDNYPFSSLEPDVDLETLGLGESADMTITAVFPGSGNTRYDASSDIYHFRMPGHGGSFFRRTNGTFAVFDTGGECGTYHIEKRNQSATDGEGGVYHCSQITITTGDGYRYVFGSLEDDEYLERVWGGKESQAKRGAIIAWRLREIVSPGGRTLHFYYEEHVDGAVQSFSADRWLGYDGNASSHALFGTSRLATYSPLTSIEADEGGEVVFHYSEKDSLHSGRFINRLGLINLNQTFATRLLDSIVVNDVTTRLSYVWNSLGNPYPFLTEVHTDGVGSWRMTYEGLADCYFPPFWTVATDHWGYLNKTSEAQCNNSTVIWSSVSQLNGYQETLQNAKSPDTTAVRAGLLTTLSYPTGGSTTFSYEANRYGKAIIKDPSNGYQPADLTSSGYGPGVRITRIENRDADGTVTDARAFSYGTGRLLSWPRYRIQYGGTIYGAPESVYYATTGGILRSGSVLLEYPSVTETRLDGSSTVRTFTDWTSCPDEFPANRVAMQRAKEGGHGNYSVNYMQNIPSPGYLRNILEPMSSLQHFRGMPLTSSEYAAGGSSPLQTVSSEYNLTVPEYGIEYINVGDACALVRRYAGEARAVSQTASKHYGQSSVTATTSYTHNDRGQVTDERTTTSTGDILRTIRTFPQDYPGDATLAAMAAANFVGYPVSEVQLRRRSGASSWDTTAAVRYTYAPYTNLLDSTAYAVSEVHRRKDDGSWLKEGSFLYDKAGNVIQQTDANGIVTSYLWNSTYGVSVVVENASRQEVAACLAQSPAVDSTDTAAAAARLRTGLPQARVSDFDYKRYGLPTRMTDPTGHTIWYAYDDNDRLISVTESDAGLLQQYQYNTVTR